MKKIGVIIFLIIIIAIGAYMLVTYSDNTSSSKLPTSSQNETTPEAVPSIDVSDLKAGGSSFKEENGTYSFLYPADFVLDEADKQHIRIYKTGGTQQGQTEMYDGALLVFEVITLDGKTLNEWVDTHIATITADGTSELIEPKKEVTLNKYLGYTFATRGLGESKNYIFQKDANSNYAVLISTLVSDPENLGFQSEVDKTITTLELFK